MITLDLLVPIAAKGALVLLLSAMIALLMANRSAAFRHMAWAGGLLALLVLPVLSLGLPELRVPGFALRAVDPGSASSRARASRRSSKSVEVGRRWSSATKWAKQRASTALESVGTASISSILPSPAPDWSMRLPGISLAGTAALLTWLLIGPCPRPGHRAKERRLARSRVDRTHRRRAAIRRRHRVCRDSRVGHAQRCPSPSGSSVHRRRTCPEGRDWSSEHRADIFIHGSRTSAAAIASRTPSDGSPRALHWFDPLAWLALYRAPWSGSTPVMTWCLGRCQALDLREELLSTARVAQIPSAPTPRASQWRASHGSPAVSCAILDAKRQRTPASGRVAASTRRRRPLPGAPGAPPSLRGLHGRFHQTRHPTSPEETRTAQIAAFHPGKPLRLSPVACRPRQGHVPPQQKRGSADGGAHALDEYLRPGNARTATGTAGGVERHRLRGQDPGVKGTVTSTTRKPTSRPYPEAGGSRSPTGRAAMKGSTGRRGAAAPGAGLHRETAATCRSTRW